MKHILGRSIREVLHVEGNVRPGKEKGHEHFVSWIEGPSFEYLPPDTGDF